MEFPKQAMWMWMVSLFSLLFLLLFVNSGDFGWVKAEAIAREMPANRKEKREVAQDEGQRLELFLLFWIMFGADRGGGSKVSQELPSLE